MTTNQPKPRRADVAATAAKLAAKGSRGQLPSQQPAEVTITVSAPYTLIGGGWTGMRPQGQRRDYTASVLGHAIKTTSKDDIKRTIRALMFRETGSNRVRFTFVQEG